MSNSTWDNIAQAAALKRRREAFTEGEEWAQRVALVMEEEPAEPPPPTPKPLAFNPNSFPTFLPKLDKLPSKLISFEQTVTRGGMALYSVKSKPFGRQTEYIPGAVGEQSIKMSVLCYKCKQSAEIEIMSPLLGGQISLYDIFKNILGPGGCPMCTGNPKLTPYIRSIKMIGMP